VKAWKVILATLVIFAAGFLTGSFLPKEVAKPLLIPAAPVRPEPAPPVPWIVQDRFLQTMQRELNLNADQTAKLKAVFADSRERMHILMDLINPELQAEKREVAERIRNELTPEQRIKFEQLLKRAHQPPDTRPRRSGPRDGRGTNAARLSPPSA
jgi:Spy/CpxP family protein refolding chaperone